MRKFYLFFLLITLCSSVSAQSVTGVIPATSEPGLAVSLTIEATSTSLTGATRAILRQGSFTYNSASLTVLSPTICEADFVIPAAAPLGLYSTQVFGKTVVTPGLFELVAGSGPKGTLNGTLHVDVDGDCNAEPAELRMPLKLVEINPGPYYALSDSLGDYSVALPLGTYTLTPVPITGLTYTCPAPTVSHTANLPTLGTIVSGLDFGLDPVAFTDLRANGSTAFPPPRPGFDNYFDLRVQNIGLLTSAPCTLSITLDPLYTFLSSSIAPVSISGTTYSFAVAALPAGGMFNVDISVNLPPSVPLGTMLSSTASIDHSDSDSINNVDVFNQTVVGSYDPNSKEVFTQFGANADGPIYVGDSILYYTIHFQNLGTASATFVIIRDTLDDKLDPTTLTVLSASHAMTASFTTSNSLEFRFMGIDLPPESVDEPGSHGHVKYLIKPRAGLDIDSTIYNTAHIYFDFNPAVVTNTVASTLSLVSVSEAPSKSMLNAYPVPASSQIHLEGPLEGRDCIIFLTDLAGKVIRTWSLSQGTPSLSTTLDLSGISQGSYLLRVESGGRSECIRIVKH